MSRSPAVLPYARRMQKHLKVWKEECLGISVSGTYGRPAKEYGHILPPELKWLNILEPFRPFVIAHLTKNGPGARTALHQYFHHLNSSQALALNLFYPWWAHQNEDAPGLLPALGLGRGRVKRFGFEEVIAKEGTNVDVLLDLDSGARVLIEVKFTEREFGTAESDDRHRKKREQAYLPRLLSMVQPEYLEEKPFFANYQLLRNISLLGETDHLILLYPADNEALSGTPALLNRMLLPAAKSRVVVRDLAEVAVAFARHFRGRSPWFDMHYIGFARKYLPEVELSSLVPAGAVSSR